MVELANNLKNASNLNVLVEESTGKSDIVFLRKIVKGGTDKSYGIYVAKMAGLPNQVISKSKIYLELLISKQKNKSLINDKELKIMIDKIDNKDAHLYNDFINELSKININEISPIEGLNILNDIIKKYAK